jgi:L-rhamnose mutarotase
MRSGPNWCGSSTTWGSGTTLSTWIPRTDTLFAAQKLTEHNSSDQLPQTDIMRRWWDHMADLMETNSDGSPVVYPLEEMFYLD